MEAEADRPVGGPQGYLGGLGVVLVEPVVVLALLLELTLTLLQLLPHGVEAVLLLLLLLLTTETHSSSGTSCSCEAEACGPAGLDLEPGHGVQQPDVQPGVVLGQGAVAVVCDELEHGAEGQWLREAVPPVPVEDLYQLVGASFPETIRTFRTNRTGLSNGGSGPDSVTSE